MRYASSSNSDHGRSVEHELDFRTLPSLRVLSLDVYPLGCRTPGAVDAMGRTRAWDRQRQCGQLQQPAKVEVKVEAASTGANSDLQHDDPLEVVERCSCTEECQLVLDVENDSGESMEVFCTTSEEALKRVWDVGGGEDAETDFRDHLGHDPRSPFADSPSRQRLCTPTRSGGAGVGAGGGQTAFSANTTVHRFVLDGNVRRRFLMRVPRLAHADMAMLRTRNGNRGGMEEGEEGDVVDQGKVLLSRVIHLCWIQPRTGISGQTKIDHAVVSRKAASEFMPPPVDIVVEIAPSVSGVDRLSLAGEEKAMERRLEEGTSEASVAPGSFATVRISVRNTSSEHISSGGIIQVWPYEDRASRGDGQSDYIAWPASRSAPADLVSPPFFTEGNTRQAGQVVGGGYDDQVTVLAEVLAGGSTALSDRIVVEGALEVRPCCSG